MAVIARLQAQGLNVGFHFDVEIDDKDTTAMIAGFSQGGLGLPERDYYFREGKKAEDIRAAYVAHIARMLELAGDSARVGQGRRRIRSWPSKPSWRRPRARSWNCATPRRTTTSSSGPRWPSWPPASIGTAISPRSPFPRSETKVLVRQPEFFTAFGGLLGSEPLAVWRDYLRWHLLSETANYLSKPFVEEHFSFYGKKLSGATELRPRWKRVLAAEDAAIGEDLGQLYVQKAFSPAAKARAQTMVELLQGSHAGADPRRRVDEPGDQGPGLQEARHHAQQGGLSRQVARLRQTRHRAAALRAERAGRQRL